VLLGNYLQARLQSRQALVERAAQLAATEYGHEIEITRGTPAINELPRLANYVAFHHAVLNLLRSRCACPVERIQELAQEFGVADDEGAVMQDVVTLDPALAVQNGQMIAICGYGLERAGG
jgi:hypothetical protein